MLEFHKLPDEILGVLVYQLFIRCLKIYGPATDEGWLYLATCIDLFSRKIVGWSMSSRMTADIVVDAFTLT